MPLETIAGIAGGIAPFASAGLDFAANRYFQKDSQSFSREMMQNRHQWEVQDLKKAGLNPILSAGTAPSMGSSPAASSPGIKENPVTAGLQAAAHSAQLKAIKAEATEKQSGAEWKNILNEIKLNLAKSVPLAAAGMAFPGIGKSVVGGLTGGLAAKGLSRRLPKVPLNTAKNTAKGTKAVATVKSGATAYKGTKLLPKKKPPTKAKFWRGGVRGMRGLNPLFMLLMMEEEVKAQQIEKMTKEERSYWNG